MEMKEKPKSSFWRNRTTETLAKPSSSLRIKKLSEKTILLKAIQNLSICEDTDRGIIKNILEGGLQKWK